MPKNEPLNAKAAFAGKRLAFIESKLPEYKAAIIESRESEFILDVQRQYFKRFPISLPHTEDPSDEELEAVDDHAPDQDLAVPSPKDLTDEEYKAAVELYSQHGNLIRFRKAQIERWLRYRRAKLAPMDIKDASPDDPMVLFMGKLLGANFLKKPVKASAVNLWISRTPTARLKADLVFTERKRNTKLIPALFMKVRTEIRQTMFQKLPEEIKTEWAEKAKLEHEEALVAHQDMMNRQPTMDAEEIQLCIDNIPALLQPILTLIFEWTGWSSTVIMGGPEPADKGRLNVVSIHGGAMPGPVPLNFGQAFRKEYMESVQPVYGEYLKMCYTPEQCRARSLTGFEERQYKSLREIAEYDTDNSMNFGVIEFGPSMAERRAAIASSSSTPTRPPGLPHPPRGMLPSQMQKQAPTTSTRISLTPAPQTVATTADTPQAQPLPPATTSLRRIPSWDTNPFSASPPPTSKGPSTQNGAGPPTTAPPTVDPKPIESSLPQTSNKVSSAQNGATPPPTAPPIPSSLSLGSRTRDKGTLLPQKRPREDSVGEQSETPSKALQQVSAAPPDGTKQKKIVKARPTARVPPTRPSSVPSEESTGHKRKHNESLQQDHSLDPTTEHSSKRSKSAGGTSTSTPSIQSSTGPARSTSTPSIQSSTGPPTASSSPSIVVHNPAGSSSGDNPSSMLDQLALIGPRKLLTSVDFGNKWIEAIAIFQRFESLHPNMPSKTKLGKPLKGFLTRPTCIGAWIARARPPNYRPDEKMTRDLVANFPSWWASLQPDDRVPGTLSEKAEDWSKIRVSSDNGFLNVMAGLLFWRNYINGGTNAQMEEWDKCLSDVVYVLHRLVDSAPSQ